MQGNGIGPLVSQLVHERNALRTESREKKGEPTVASKKAIKPHPHGDTVELSDAAMARFEALKARLAGEESGGVSESTVGQPGTEPSSLETDPFAQPDPGDGG